MNTRTQVPMTVFVVDDDEAIREGVCNLLESEGLNARSYASTFEFLAAWREEEPGCLLLDVRLPGMSGVEFQERLSSGGIGIPIIFMTAHGDIPMVRKVMKAGAIEFLTKPFQREELLCAIRAAFERERVRHEEKMTRESLLARFETLSQRERDVMAMATKGMLNKQIAANLQISEVTVKLHRRHVMEKMRAQTFADLVRAADALKRL